MRRIRTVNDIVDWRLCVGCGACAYVCPEDRIELTNVVRDGIRPIVRNTNCGDCSLCLAVCPAWENDHRPLARRTGLIPELTRDFGPVVEMWEGYAADPEIRHRGASGGVLTALSLFCLEREGMGGILHIGGDPSEPLVNSTRLSRTREELLMCSGSRYAPASACDRLDLLEGLPVPGVFIGQPSEVTALRKAQALRPALDNKVGAAFSFFCAGSPSYQGTLDLLQRMGIKAEEVEELRYRGLGWPGMFATRSSGDPSFKPLSTYQESWGFLQKYRPFSVHLIPDGLGEDADISCGDPWYTPPTPGEEGRSMILARTEKGRKIVLAAQAAGYLTLEPSHPERLRKSQINLVRKRGAIWGRILALKLLGLPAPRLLGFSLFRNWMTLPVREKAKSVLGTLRRAIGRKYYRPAPIVNTAVRKIATRCKPQP